MTNRESDTVVLLGTVLCHHVDTCHTIRTAEIGGDGLVRELTDREDVRYYLRVMRQGVGIILHHRVEALQTHAVDEDVRQEGVATQLTSVTNGIGVAYSALREDDDLLQGVVHVVLHDGLTRTSLDCQFRQRCSFVNRHRIFKGIRIESRRQTKACELHVHERSIAVLGDVVLHGIGLFLAVLSAHYYCPFAFGYLTEEHYLGVLRSLVTQARISATGS